MLKIINKKGIIRDMLMNDASFSNNSYINKEIDEKERVLLLRKTGSEITLSGFYVAGAAEVINVFWSIQSTALTTNIINISKSVGIILMMAGATISSYAEHIDAQSNPENTNFILHLILRGVKNNILYIYNDFKKIPINVKNCYDYLRK